MSEPVDYDWVWWFSELEKCETIAEIYSLCILISCKCNHKLEFDNISQQCKNLSNNGWPLLADFLMSAQFMVRSM